MLDAVDAWHHSDTRRSLSEWLGLSADQYAAWIEIGVLPDGYEPPVEGDAPKG